MLDLAGAHIQALKNLDKHPDGKYNLGNGQGFSNLEVVKTMEIVTGEKVPFEFAPEDLVILQHWWHPQNWPTRNLAGIQNSQSWKKSLPQHGSGIGNIPMAINKAFR